MLATTRDHSSFSLALALILCPKFSSQERDIRLICESRQQGRKVSIQVVAKMTMEPVEGAHSSASPSKSSG